MRTYPCDCCGKFFPLHMLDSKPEQLAGPGRWIDRVRPHSRLLNALFGPRRIELLILAGDIGEDFTRSECRTCYGPGWISGLEEIHLPEMTPENAP